MIYTIEKANLIATQLKKITSGYMHHIVGQFSNIDFWMDEVILALKTIDGHKKRFSNMYDAQKEWTKNHDVVIHEYCPICSGRCEFSDGKPQLPTLKYKKEKIKARKDLVDSAYFFLIRCYRIGLLTCIMHWNFVMKLSTAIKYNVF